jgi:hypothetical protein
MLVFGVRRAQTLGDGKAAAREKRLCMLELVATGQDVRRTNPTPHDWTLSEMTRVLHGMRLWVFLRR